MSSSFPFQHMFILPILNLTPQKVAILEDSQGDTVYPLKANMEPNIIWVLKTFLVFSLSKG